MIPICLTELVFDYQYTILSCSDNVRFARTDVYLCLHVFKIAKSKNGKIFSQFRREFSFILVNLREGFQF